ncbi:universal stress protein [Actinokineospora sp. PR83]|uniref:universal stress protein n=1 Tax=Actinokineospora sp. PR83 TaxID=2884908 RepID=UPI001F157870|nr:universal stress protein [Actinokineospora sp. PR83]MCG8917497.1 universal stress protein [Actinokineospora sp. PR83]
MSHHDNTIVVGFDGSPAGVAALRWAVAQSRRYAGARVTAVHVHAPEAAFVPAMSMGIQPHGAPHPDHDAAALARLVDEVSTETVAHGQVDLAEVPGRSGRVLAEAARDTLLVVIGAHHTAPRLADGVGAFAAEVVRHAHCPVAIIPADRA